MFNYSNDSFTPFTGASNHVPISLPSSSNPLLITQPAHEFAFRAGILNSLVNGRYVVVAEARDVERVSNIYDKIDLIATEDVYVNSNATVYVQKGSSVLSGHNNRI